MASFAKIGLNNKVIEVLSVHNNELKDSNGIEQEINNNFATWKQEYLDYQPTEVVLENRRKEYPSIEDQLDEIYHNGINAWKATIKVTKDKYPKS